MKTLKTFVVRHDIRIIQVGTILLVLPAMIFFFLGDVITALNLFGCYVAFFAIVSFISFGGIHRKQGRIAAHRK